MQSLLGTADNQFMPGILHQGILSVFRADPWLPFDLLGIERPASGTPIDRRNDAEAPGANDGKLRVGMPDLVLLCDGPNHPDGAGHHRASTRSCSTSRPSPFHPR